MFQQMTPAILLRGTLLLFVDKQTLVSWMTWVPPRHGNNFSIATQFQRALSESVSILLRQNKNLAASRQPHRVGYFSGTVRPMHRRVGSVERCINVPSAVRIAEVQRLTIKPQRQIGMLLKVARVPPLASKAIRTRESRGDHLTGSNRPSWAKFGRCSRKNLPVSRKLPMKRIRLCPIFLSGQVPLSWRSHASLRPICPYRSVSAITAKSGT